MISIKKATESDFASIVNIGKISVAESHQNSSPEKVMNEYLANTYNNDVIREELNNSKNIYHIITYDAQPVGFSKVVLNSTHSNINAENVTKLDRIYLLKEFHGLKLGLELLNFNIRLSKDNRQNGIWLYTWIGNQKATNFYLRAGFKIIGSHQFYVTDTHYDESHQILLSF